METDKKKILVYIPIEIKGEEEEAIFRWLAKFNNHSIGYSTHAEFDNPEDAMLFKLKFRL